MTVEVTVVDHDNGDQESMELDGVTHVLVVNEAEGFYLANEVRYGNGTTVLTIKRTLDADSNEVV